MKILILIVVLYLAYQMFWGVLGIATYSWLRTQPTDRSF